LQFPAQASAELRDALTSETFTVPQFRAVFDAMQAAGGVASAGRDWVDRVREEAGETLASGISRLAVTPVAFHNPREVATYVDSVLRSVLDLSITRRISKLRGTMQRMGEGGEGYSEVFAQVIALEGEKRALRGD